VPSEGDVYTILKYLALVARRPGAQPVAPDETQQYQVVFSADPARMAALGWGGRAGHRGAKLLGLDAFAESEASSKEKSRKKDERAMNASAKNGIVKNTAGSASK